MSIDIKDQMSIIKLRLVDSLIEKVKQKEKSKIKKITVACIHVFFAFMFPYWANNISILVYMAMRNLSAPVQVIMSYISQIISFLLMLCFYLRFIMRKDLKDIGLGKPYGKGIWIIVAFVLPLTVLVTTMMLAGGQVIKGNMSSIEMQEEIFGTLFMGITAGIIEECAVRGLMMKSLEMVVGKKIAITVSALSFTVIHFSWVAEAEIVSQVLLLVAGVCLSVMMSVIVYATGSVWCGVWIHGIWNMLIIGDVFALKQEVEIWDPCIYTFVMSQKNPLVTGGKFGVEASLVSIISYGIVIFIAVYIIKKQEKAKRNI